MKQKEVTSEARTAQWISKHGAKVAGAIVGLAVLFGAYLGYGAYMKSQEEAAQEELFGVQKKIEKITKDLADAANPKAEADPKDKKAKKPEPVAETPKTPETLEKNYSAALSDAEAFIEKNKTRVAGSIAAVQVAGLATTYKDHGRAERVLQAVVKSRGKGELFYGLVRSQLGAVLMDQKKFAEAAPLFKEIVDSPGQSYFHAQALLRWGACLLETGEIDKAEGIFTQLEADHPKTQAAQQAKNLKRLAALKKGQKAS